MTDQQPLPRAQAIREFLKDGVWRPIDEADASEASMIERLARVICAESGTHEKPDGDDLHWRDHVPAARAVLIELQKPSEGMMHTAYTVTRVGGVPAAYDALITTAIMGG